MAKVSVVTPEKTQDATLPDGLAGAAKARTYLPAGQFPLQLHSIDIAEGEVFAVGPMDVDCVVYVWNGAVVAGGTALAQGSSLVVERGATLEIVGSGDGARLLAFAASEPTDSEGDGGAVHLLPVERVPRSDDLGGSGVGGGMHADSDCPTCDVWLHENHFAGAEPLSEEDQKRGIHSHSEDEIIFVIDGEMRLGNRLCGAGTALAIAADTLYAFTPGPDGLSFINFRAGKPGDIQFANGPSMSETGYWREKLPRPEYVSPA